jgi:hypothetical protein
MEFTMFRNYEGYSRSGYGSQSDCYKYVGYENGQLMFKSLEENSNYILKATKDQFLNGLDETYLHTYHRYQLASNYDRDEVVSFIQGL